MQVANTLNNQIRILFNPTVENFKLLDFLLVRSENGKYLAQIIEIYDDKFDSSQNVAKLKLFYKISQDNEVLPYDNFTPNKECEIIKIKQEEVEDFINQDKETFVFAKNAKSSNYLKLQYDFFMNNPIILADKAEDGSNIICNLAKNLSEKRNVVIIDATGALKIKGSAKLNATKDFKLPLEYSTIDFVYDKLLEDTSLKFQSIVGDILNQIKKFAKYQDSEFIPFNAFIRVIHEQYKATPYKELKLLITKMKRCQMDEIFARTKRDKENLYETIKDNKITIIDLSNISCMWQKAFFEYISSTMKNNVFLFSRINEENCDTDIINNIYNKHKNVKFIPSVSYNYKRLPSVIQHCKNYILLSSLYQRNDFLNANFALSNLISTECIIFGENTDDFLYIAKDFEASNKEEKIKYKKIALSLLDNEEEQRKSNLGENGDYFENIKKSESELSSSDILLKKLADLDEQQSEQETSIKAESEEEKEDFDESNDDFLNISDYKDKKVEIKEELEKIHQDAIDNQKDEFPFVEDIKNEEAKELEEVEQSEVQEEIVPIQEEYLEIEENPKIESTPVEEQKEELEDKEYFNLHDEQKVEQEAEENKEETDDLVFKEEVEIDDDLSFDTLNEDETDAKTTTDDELEIENEEQEFNLNDSDSEVALTDDENQSDLSDDELDFFQIAKESSEKYDNNDSTEAPVDVVTVDDVEYKTQNTTNDNIKKDELSSKNNADDVVLDASLDDDIDLNELAQNSIEDSFSEIINEEQKGKSHTDENSEIPNDILDKTTEKNENLPIFKEKIEQTEEDIIFKVGQYVTHTTYGKGQVIKTVKYEGRQLLNIQFEELNAAKMLDPKLANIKPLEQ